jgi:hypothetical protein
MGRDKYKYLSCSNDDDGDGDCEYCGKKFPRERRGQARWELATMWSQSLGETNRSLHDRCECGGAIKRGACKKCDELKPLSIFKVPFTVSRSGVQKKTSYQFIPGKHEKCPDWMADLEPPDLDKLYQPLSTERQAAILKVRNPFVRDENYGNKSSSRFIMDDDNFPTA